MKNDEFVSDYPLSFTSKEVAKIAVILSMSTREEENELKKKYDAINIKTAAVDVGGDLIASIPKILERALVASKRNHIIPDKHVYDGAIAGATRDAIEQVLSKATGLNVGGKIGIARYGEHVAVSIFLSIGLLHLDEIVIGMSHRAIPKW